MHDEHTVFCWCEKKTCRRSQKPIELRSRTLIYPYVWNVSWTYTSSVCVCMCQCDKALHKCIAALYRSLHYHWSKKWHQKYRINNYNLMNQGSVNAAVVAAAAAIPFFAVAYHWVCWNVLVCTIFSPPVRIGSNNQTLSLLLHAVSFMLCNAIRRDFCCCCRCCHSLYVLVRTVSFRLEAFLLCNNFLFSFRLLL